MHAVFIVFTYGNATDATNAHLKSSSINVLDTNIKFYFVPELGEGACGDKGSGAKPAEFCRPVSEED